MRPSFHCATGCPSSAAYCRAVSDVSGTTALEPACGMAFRRPAAAPDCAVATGMVDPWLTGAPSNAKDDAGATSGATPSSNATMNRSDVRIAMFLVRTTWVGNGPGHRRPNLLGIFPKRTRRVIRLARRPFGFALRKLGVAQLYVKGAYVRIDLDDIAILRQRDRPTDRGFRPDMADAEAAGSAGEAAIGDQSDLAAHALSGQCRGGLQHLAHAGTAARTLVADDQDLAFLVGAVLHRLEGILLAIEAAGRPG